ncbi:SMP-30/gluconolactonase/LRE family protein [Corticibacterium sp. UT-5YL-CI-8]|nr:SMP-30/gluconolactonase/LRE family protein [Tianweitania sp. UT-5YL-CI-8]
MPDVQGSFSKHISFELVIGESPVWDEDRQALWFVDILAPAIYMLDPQSGMVKTHPMPASVGSVGLADKGRLIVALRSGVHLYDPQSRTLQFLVHPEPDVTVNRLNDGKVGPDGCFWVGSMHDSMPRAPTGSLYRITPDGQCARMLDGIHVSNGLAWSPDGATMYHADSRGSVRAFDFDARSGQLSRQRVLVTLSEPQGLADGAAVDVEGFYWSAGVTAGCIHQIAPDGSVVASIAVPCHAPTMPCFGGRDLRTLFVTSLSTRRSGKPDPGTLISCDMDVAGVPVGKFG